MGTRKRPQARRRIPKTSALKRPELSDVLIPLVYGDPHTLADGLGRMKKRSYGVTEEGRIFERKRKSQEHRTETQLAVARKRIHDESERLRRKFDRGGDGPPF